MLITTNSLSISFDDGFAYFVVIAVVLFLLFMAILAIKDRIAEASKEKVKRKIRINAEIDREFEDLRNENAKLSERCEEFRSECKELREKLSFLNQQDYKSKYEELNKVYYRMYMDYVDNPTWSINDLFPNDEETVSILMLQTKLNVANGKIDDLERQLVSKKRDFKELERERDVLKEMNQEMFSDNKDLLRYIDQIDEEKSDKAQIQQISVSLKKNAPLFYNSSDVIKNFYSKMNAKKVYNAFDPTLCFESITCTITHSDGKEKYETSLTSCSCPDFQKKLKGSAPCKHMIFLAYNIGNLFINKDASDKYFKEDIGFLTEKQKATAEIKKLKGVKQELKTEVDILTAQKTALSDGNEEQ